MKETELMIKMNSGLCTWGRLSKIKRNLGFIWRAVEVNWNPGGLCSVHLYVVHSFSYLCTHSSITFWGPFSLGPGTGLGSRDNMVNKHIPGRWSYCNAKDLIGLLWCWLQAQANQMVHGPRGVTTLPFSFCWGKQGSDRWHMSWVTAVRGRAGICRTLKPPVFLPAPAESATPGRLLSCFILHTQGRVGKASGKRQERPQLEPSAKSLLNSWLTETMWDNKSFLML